MTSNINHDLSGGRYVPTAIYYEEADCLEYVRDDIACVYRRIDEILTVIVSIDTREPCGFKIKGFKNFYIKHRPQTNLESDTRFTSVVEIIEQVFGQIGDDLFKKDERRRAYDAVYQIAKADQVVFEDQPAVA